MRLSVRRQLLLAQLAPLIPVALVGLAAVLALIRMTVVVHDARTVRLEHISQLEGSVDLFREEVVLLQRYRESGDPAIEASARDRGARLRARLDQAGPTGAELVSRVRAYEALAGLEGGRLGDPADVDAEARRIVREIRTRRDRLRFALQEDLAGVARVGRATATGVVIVVGLLLVSATLVALAFGRSVVSALEALERGTDALATGHFDHRIRSRREDELGRLAGHFNRMAERLGALDRMKVDFFANISHDLKTPLTSLLEASDLLEEEVAGPLTPPQKRLVAVLQESARRLRGLVANVLDLSRLGAAGPDLAPGDALAAVDSAIEELQLLATSCAVTLSRTPCESLPPVLVNPGMLGQVLQNLLDNAIKFSPRGGRVVVHLSQVDPSALASVADSAVRVAVCDQGPGVPAELRERVFDRFFQGPGEGARSGSGLGLYICKQVVAAHGGTVGVEAGETGGANVWFTLPVAPSRGS